MFGLVAAGDLAGVRGAVEGDPRLLEERNGTGNCPLTVAAYYGHLELVEYLAAQGAPLEARSNDGFTALLLSAQEGHHAMVRLNHLLHPSLHLEMGNSQHRYHLLKLQSCFLLHLHF